MVRVLQIIDHMKSGGIQAFVMNVYRNIDRNAIQFDFLLHHKYEHPYYDEIQKLGGRIYYVPPRSKGIIKNRKALHKFFIEHPEYEIVHLHESSLSYITPLQVAKKHQVRKRIMHSHNTNISGNKLHRILHWWHKKNIDRIATDYLACGELAAKWMYGGSNVEHLAKVVYNGIKVTYYEYDEHKRMQVRNNLGIPNESLVIGHVGRFNKVKNQKFLLNIIDEMKRLRKDVKLLLIGTGPSFDEIQTKAKEMELNNEVLFLGVRNDVYDLMQAMDVFVLPSLYEGFPVVAVEAQASGLSVLMSDRISTEVVLKDNVKQMSLNVQPSVWADEIVNLSGKRIPSNMMLYEKGFDISTTINQLSQIYAGE